MAVTRMPGKTAGNSAPMPPLAAASSSKPATSSAASLTPTPSLQASAAQRVFIGLDCGRLQTTVRQYSTIEWLRLLPQAETLVAALAAAISAGRSPSYEVAVASVAAHADAIAPLIALAAGLAPAVFNALQPDDGELLLMIWWGENGRFFVQRAINRVDVARAEAAGAVAA